MSAPYTPDKDLFDAHEAFGAAMWELRKNLSEANTSLPEGVQTVFDELTLALEFALPYIPESPLKNAMKCVYFRAKKQGAAMEIKRRINAWRESR